MRSLRTRKERATKRRMAGARTGRDGGRRMGDDGRKGALGMRRGREWVVDDIEWIDGRRE